MAEKLGGGHWFAHVWFRKRNLAMVYSRETKRKFWRLVRILEG